MKKLILHLITLIALSLGANAQNVNIPDANFKAYLVGNTSINTNGDTEIQVSEAVAFTGTIQAANLGISDLTGIEAFPNITTLYCHINNLTSLDISQNIALVTLDASDNVLNTINLGQNQNNVLTSLNLYNNNLTTVDISQHTALTLLSVTNNNNITTLDLNQSTALETLFCSVTSINSLDVSTCPNLASLYCGSNNDLTTLNMKNISTSTLSTFFATNNPNLTCIEVDDVAAANSNWTNIDATASFSTNCCTINIPDANFKSYLLGNSAINTNADSEIQCSEATAFTGTINCQNLNISDLTGIEAFTSLTMLLCGNNPLGTIDVSQNTALVTFQPHNNGLSSLDVSQNLALSNFVCVNNNLTSLDVSQNTNLYLFSCGFNNLTSLDVSQNTDLANLSVNNNQLSSLDVSQNTDLTNLFCDTNNLSTLDVSTSPNISNFSCASNNLEQLNMKNLSTTTLVNFNATSNPNLTCIEVDDVSAATTAWTNIDATASFSLSCAILVTSIDVIGQGGATTITTQGGTLQMEANVLPANADDATYTWSVIDGTGSASIDANGLLTAISDGTVTVTATANDASGVTGDAVITISNQSILVNSITVQGQGGQTSITTNGGTLQMEAVVLPANADDATYTWSVIDGTGDATIDANGLLTAISDGTVTVTATANDASGVTGEAVITISNQTVGIKEQQLEVHQLSIFPNPVSSQLNINYDKEIIVIKVIDVTGRTVLSTSDEKNTIDVSDLTKGIYFLQIETDKGLLSSKFIKE